MDVFSFVVQFSQSHNIVCICVTFVVLWVENTSCGFGVVQIHTTIETTSVEMVTEFDNVVEKAGSQSEVQ